MTDADNGLTPTEIATLTEDRKAAHKRLEATMRVRNGDKVRQVSEQYSVILADPPWRFRTWSGIDNVGRARRHGLVVGHYQPMNLKDICALPVKELAADDCVLFLWACWPLLQDAMAAIEAWGFTYKTVGFVWVKQNRGGWGYHMGMGYWSRSNTEPCLLATRGHPKRLAADVGQLIVSPVRAHSRKPDEAYDKIERLVGTPKRIELFARRRREGWDAFGDEVESDIVLEAST